MTSVRKVKWTNCGKKRFREQQNYITNDNCREVAIERTPSYSHLAISPAQSPVAAAICSGESFIAFKLRTV